MLTGAVNVGISQVKYASYETGGSNKTIHCYINSNSIFIDMLSRDKLDECQGICLKYSEIDGYKDFISLLKEKFMKVEKEVKEQGKRNADPKPSIMYTYSTVYFYKGGRMRYGDGDVHSLVTLVDGDVTTTISSNNLIANGDNKVKFKGIVTTFKSERDFEMLLSALSKSAVSKGKALYKKNL